MSWRCLQHPCASETEETRFILETPLCRVRFRGFSSSRPLRRRAGKKGNERLQLNINEERKQSATCITSTVSESPTSVSFCGPLLFLHGATTEPESRRSLILFLPIFFISPPYPRRHHSSIFDDHSASLALHGGTCCLPTGPKNRLSGRQGET